MCGMLAIVGGIMVLVGLGIVGYAYGNSRGRNVH